MKNVKVVVVSGVDDLATNYPDLMEEWDTERNTEDGFDPGQLLPSSPIKAAWICRVCRYRWRAGIASRTKGIGCPSCRARKMHAARKKSGEKTE